MVANSRSTTPISSARADTAWSAVPSSGRSRNAASSRVIRRSGCTIIRCRPTNSITATSSDSAIDKARMRVE